MAMPGKAPYYLLKNQPFRLSPPQSRNPYLIAFYKSLQGFHLKHVKRVEFKFDPFHESVKSIRDLMYHTSAKKIRATNLDCTFRNTVITDRSEPTLTVNLVNGKVLEYRTSQLTPLEIVTHWQKTVNLFTEEQI
jgi:hypothetical protein